MSEATQTYLGLESESRQTNPGFQSVLNYIRERATSEYRKGELFERLMLTYLSEDPDYKEQFSEVWLYKQWAAQRTDFDANDIGIDLVATGTRWRILRHPVQMLRRRYTDCKARPRLIHLRFRKRTLHVTTDRRYRRRMGTQRTQNH